MPLLRLGNDAPIQGDADLPGPAVTTVGLPDDTDTDGNLIPLWSLDEAFTSVTHPTNGVWVKHSTGSPAWVSCPDWPELEQRLAGYYGAKTGVQAGYGIDVPSKRKG